MSGFNLLQEKNNDEIDITLDNDIGNAGMKNVKIQQEKDEPFDFDDELSLKLKKVEKESQNSSRQKSNASSREHSPERRREEPKDVSFGLDLLINPKKTKPSEKKDLYEPEPALAKKYDDDEPINTWMPDLLNKKKTIDSPQSSYRRRHSSRKTESSRKRRRSSSRSRHSKHSRHDYNSHHDSQPKYDEPPTRMPQQKYLTPEEADARKAEILRQFKKLQKNGYNFDRTFTMNSELPEMEKEYLRVKKEIEIDNSIYWQRGMLLNGIMMLEWANEKYDPFDFYLKGFSEHTMQNIGRYDGIFEELYEKYHDRVNVPPEVRLMLSVGGSAMLFHWSHNMSKNNNNEKEKYKQLLEKYERREQERNNEYQRQKMEAQNPQYAQYQQYQQMQQQQQQQPMPPQMMRDGYGREFMPQTAGMMPPQQQMMPPQPQETRQQRQMNGPSAGNVEEIMRRMRERERAETISVKTAVDSETSAEEVFTERKVNVPDPSAGRRQRSRKPPVNNRRVII